MYIYPWYLARFFFAIERQSHPLALWICIECCDEHWTSMRSVERSFTGTNNWHLESNVFSGNHDGILFLLFCLFVSPLNTLNSKFYYWLKLSGAGWLFTFFYSPQFACFLYLKLNMCLREENNWCSFLPLFFSSNCAICLFSTCNVEVYNARLCNAYTVWINNVTFMLLSRSK